MTSKTEQNKVYTLMGASNHTAQDRPPLDMYTTDPTAVEALLQKEKFDANIWEPACGTGNISEVLKTHGYTVYNSDVFDYGYSDMHKQLDFLLSPCSFDGDIVANPPFSEALEFAQPAVDAVGEGHKVALLLRLQFLEGVKRREFFNVHPPKCVYVFSKRTKCHRQGKADSNSPAICFAWFVWEKGYTGKPSIDWI